MTSNTGLRMRNRDLEDALADCIRALEICLEAENNLRSTDMILIWNTLNDARLVRDG